MDAMESEAKAWIEELVDVKLSGSLMEELKSGVVLCNLVNAIEPGIAPAPSTSKMPFKQVHMRKCMP